ncbi:hypothetical protein EEL33_06390 [Muribaculaceae bacterium Isolate-037 (Harlan)]|nr:hypothetical protein EEL33_06390 [Muribaculaceae bacterium Isolate-037 (Harlan)]
MYNTYEALNSMKRGDTPVPPLLIQKSPADSLQSRLTAGLIRWLEFSARAHGRGVPSPQLPLQGTGG